jgi:hypothetical protein
LHEGRITIKIDGMKTMTAKKDGRINKTNRLREKNRLERRSEKSWRIHRPQFAPELKKERFQYMVENIRPTGNRMNRIGNENCFDRNRNAEMRDVEARTADNDKTPWKKSCDQIGAAGFDDRFSSGENPIVERVQTE